MAFGGTAIASFGGLSDVSTRWTKGTAYSTTSSTSNAHNTPRVLPRVPTARELTADRPAAR